MLVCSHSISLDRPALCLFLTPRFIFITKLQPKSSIIHLSSSIMFASSDSSTTFSSSSSSSSTSSSKMVYAAVPLLPKAAVADEQVREALIPKNNDDNDALSTTTTPSLLSRCLYFVTGTTMGMFCYYAIHGTVLPTLPHMTNDAVDCIFAAMVWSATTTVFAYSIWFGFILALRCCCRRNHHHHQACEENEDQDEDHLYWEHMEQYYANGIFWGFSTSCIVSLALAGVPAIFLVTITLSAIAWTGVMAFSGRQEAQEVKIQRNKTVLPMVMV